MAQRIARLGGLKSRCLAHGLKNVDREIVFFPFSPLLVE